MSKIDDLDRLYAQVRQTRGRIDILFANASIAEPHAFDTLTEEVVDRHLDVNIKGPVFTVERALPLLSDGGSIIVTSSVDGVKGGPGRGVGDIPVTDFFTHLASTMPGGRILHPDEVAAAVTFLASQDASGINGIDLAVDAGFAQI